MLGGEKKIFYDSFIMGLIDFKQFFSSEDKTLEVSFGNLSGIQKIRVQNFALFCPPPDFYRIVS